MLFNCSLKWLPYIRNNKNNYNTHKHYMCMLCANVCMSICMYACMHVCMYICVCICVHACMHICMCMCVCIYIQKFYSYPCLSSYLYNYFLLRFYNNIFFLFLLLFAELKALHSFLKGFDAIFLMLKRGASAPPRSHQIHYKPL